MGTNTSGVSPWMDGPVTDTGTGAYEGPPASVTVESPAPEPAGGAYVDTGTGEYINEGGPVTVESPPEHLSEPTGAHPGPPASVTTTAWPAEQKGEPMESKAVTEADTKAVQVADNKAVTAPATKTAKGGRKAGR